MKQYNVTIVRMKQKALLILMHAEWHCRWGRNSDAGDLAAIAILSKTRRKIADEISEREFVRAFTPNKYGEYA